MVSQVDGGTLRDVGSTTDRVLALDIDATVVRGIVLASGSQASAGGYAQLGFDPEHGPAHVAARIAEALDARKTLPVVLTCAESFDEATALAVVSSVGEKGFVEISVVPREESLRRSNPDGGDVDKLVDADIASGLLTSHAGLTLRDLAPVVGAGLGVLGLGATVPGDDPEPIAIWQPEGPPATETDLDETGLDDAATVEVAAGLDETDLDEPASVEDSDRAADSVVPDDDPFTVSETAAASAAVAAVAGAAAIAPDDMFGDDSATLADLEDDTIDPAALAEPVIAEPESDLAAVISPPTAGASNIADDATGKAATPIVAAAPAGTTGARRVEPEPRRKKGWLLALLGLLLLAAVAVAALFLLGNDDDSASTADVAEAAPASDSEEEAATVNADDEQTEAVSQASEPTAAAEPTAVPEPTATAEPTTEPAQTAAADDTTDLPPLSSLPDREAIFRPPTLFLEGPVTQEQADELYARAAAVVGPENIENNYIIRSDAPELTDGNVRIEQAVLFGYNSADISDQFIPVLELGVAVMGLNPQVTMVIEGHTDAVGDDGANLRLSEKRAQAVVAYLEGRGVDPERLQAIGRGETDPVASNEDPTGRQINRRIEVELLDLLADAES